MEIARRIWEVITGSFSVKKISEPPQQRRKEIAKKIAQNLARMERRLTREFPPFSRGVGFPGNFQTRKIKNEMVKTD